LIENCSQRRDHFKKYGVFSVLRFIGDSDMLLRNLAK